MYICVCVRAVCVRVFVCVCVCLYLHTNGQVCRPCTSTEIATLEFDYTLGDRVVSYADAGLVPFGLRGTVVAVLEGEVDVVFDSEFIGGTNLHTRLTSM